MNWRRGILLAGIHMAVAVPLIIILEVRDEASMREGRDDHTPPAWIASDPVLKTAPSGDEGQAVTLDLCTMWVEYSARVQVASFANLPAITLSGWQQVCPPRWTLAGRLNVGYSFFPSRATISSRREVDWGFGLLVAVQWILVGSFPFAHPKRWWAEPGAFITCCTVIAFGLVLIRPVEGLARLPAMLAAFAWFWWFGLLVWTGVRLGWKHLRAR